jgi:hypothetical protein
MTNSPRGRLALLRKLVLITGLLSASLGNALASPTVLNFDDLSGDPAQPIAAGYGGFEWQTLASIRAADWPASGFAHSAVSGANAAYNWDGGAVSIRWTGAGSFNFNGAYFTSAWQEQELVFEGWQGGQLRHATLDSVLIGRDGPLWVHLGWDGIDELRIYNSANQWAMDDFSFTAAVPEPATLWLLLPSGLAVLASRRQRSRPCSAAAVRI